MTIEHHARQALSTIRNRQPDGRLALAGYSFGGLVAYEVARQAVHAGQHVEWLGILDELAPSMVQLRRAQLTRRWRLREIRRLPARQRWATYGEAALRVLRRGPLSPEKKNGVDFRDLIKVECRYQAPGHEVPMHLFVTESSAADAETDLLGWDEFHGGMLTVDRLPGSHFTMLEPPVVKQLAQAMLESLCKSRESTRGQRAVATLPRPNASAPYPPAATDSASADASMNRVGVPSTPR